MFALKRTLDGFGNGRRLKMSKYRIDRLRDDIDSVLEAYKSSLTPGFEDDDEIPPKLSDFSEITSDDLEMAGIERKGLDITSSAVDEQVDPSLLEDIKSLHAQLDHVFKHVNLCTAASSSTILAVYTLWIGAVMDKRKDGPQVVVVPGFEVKEAGIVNPRSGYNLRLPAGTVDHLVIKYKKFPGSYADDTRMNLLSSVQTIFPIASGYFIIVEAGPNGLRISNYVNKAMAQVVSFMVMSGISECHFCLSNGRAWTFCMLKSENGKYTYYESMTFRLDSMQHNWEKTCMVAQLLLNWIHPSDFEPFELEN